MNAPAWSIPTMITVLSILFAIILPVENGEYSGLRRLGVYGIAFAASVASWVIFAIYLLTGGSP